MFKPLLPYFFYQVPLVEELVLSVYYNKEKKSYYLLHRKFEETTGLYYNEKEYIDLYIIKDISLDEFNDFIDENPNATIEQVANHFNISYPKAEKLINKFL